MSTIPPTIFSFFSGAGFLDLGFEKNGFNVSLVNEIHEPFVQAYQYSRQRMGINQPRHGYIVDDIDQLLTPQGLQDLREMAADSWATGAPLGFIGGPPCPDFSVGGKNKGQEGENGKLSKSYIDLICAVRPTFFMFENVKGLWRTVRHRAFYESLKVQLRAAGYSLTEKLINAIEYGAPQDRDRIILFGVQTNSLNKPEMTEIQLTEAFSWDSGLKFPGRSAFTSFQWPSTDGVPHEHCVVNPEIPKELTVAYWFERNQVKTHANQVDHFQPRAGLAKFQTVQEGDVSKKSYKRLHRFRYSPTAAYGNNEVHIHPTESRRITVAEALAIQSLPSEFCLPPKMTLTNKFKTVGNGVPFVAAQGLAITIRKFLEEHVREIDSRKSGEGDQQAAQAKVVRIHQRALWDKSSGNRRHTA
jgi:DNA (cytosine-5)-methyltransferase 1